MSREKVMVIGGGPAGLAAAIACRMRGLDVTLLEGARPPVDKACGEAILPAGVEALRQLGVLLSCNDGFPLRGIRFVSDGRCVEAAFAHRGAIAMRRTVLHTLLAARAADIGIRLYWNTQWNDAAILPGDRWLVGADGHNSRIRRLAGLDAQQPGSARFGFRRHYRMSPWTDCVEVHWGDSCQVYVTPVARDEVGVALLCRDPRLRLDAALERFPFLHRLRNIAATSSERGAPTISRRLAHVYSGRTALVGDASGSTDAITGDGLSASFEQAVLIGEALSGDNLAVYQAAHSRMARRRALIETLLLTLDRYPVLRRSVIRALAWEPSVLGRLLAVHTSLAKRPASVQTESRADCSPA